MKTLYFSAANTNEHVNNLLQSTTDPGWEINVDYGKWTERQDVDDACGPPNVDRLGCEKCPTNQIAVDGNCKLCPNGEIPNSDQTICVAGTK